jgi:hypothetical protein
MVLGYKEPLLPHPLHSSVGGAVERGALSPAFKICFIKIKSNQIIYFLNSTIHNINKMVRHNNEIDYEYDIT